MRVTDARDSAVVAADVRLTGALACSGNADANGAVSFGPLPPGDYRVIVEAPGFAPAELSLSARAGESVRLVARLERPGASSVIQVSDRSRPAYGTTFDAAQLRGLPWSGSLWSVLETAEAAAITDRIEGGGLYAGEPALVGVHGSSWTQSSYRFGDLDVTDPDQGGTPLLLPDLGALEAVEVDSALAPVEAGGPGATLTLTPRRPGPRWRGALDARFSSADLQSSAAAEPAVAREGSLKDVDALAGGPLVKDRVGLLLAGRLARSRRLERNDPTELRSDLSSLLAHLIVTPNARDEVRVLAAFQAATRPFAGRARLGSQAVTERDRFLHLQSTWERRGAGLSWSVSGGYQRGAAEPDVAPSSAIATVERLSDGPAPELVSFSRSRRERWDFEARLRPDLRALAGGRHAVRLGMAVSHAAAVTWPLSGAGLVAETVAGLPARLWDYGYRGPESRWRATDVAVSAADRIALPGRVEAELGLRFEATSASADGGGDVSWRSLSPRVRARWRWSEAVALFAGYGRYRHRLPLRTLAYSDPAGPQGAAYLWNDDGDRLFEPGERGALLTRLAPSSIDPDLRRPHTDEVAVGLEWRSGSFTTRLTGLRRRERDLMESVNVGVPLSSYRVRFVPDPAGDILGPADDQLLPIYDRDPASFGQDRFVLTNPSDHTTLYEGVELMLEKPFGRRFRMLLGATASRASGRGANRGFRAVENDQGLVGEAFDGPNADTNAFGRLFFDRAYTVKIAASYRAPWDVRLGAVARYQDGQPFARVVVASDLNQGPEAVQAIPRGRARFSYTATLDARLEKGIAVGPRRAALCLEAFNLLGARNEVEEDVVTGPAYRTPTAAQPPRALRIGLRLEF